MRRHDWASRMDAVIESCKRTPFEYGTHDCGMFVARVVDAMTDDAIAYRLREHYCDEASAQEFIEASGGMLAVATRFLGSPSNDRPRRGDPVLFEGGNGEAMGIWTPQGIYSTGASGLHLVKERKFLAVFHV